MHYNKFNVSCVLTVLYIHIMPYFHTLISRRFTRYKFYKLQRTNLYNGGDMTDWNGQLLRWNIIDEESPAITKMNGMCVVKRYTDLDADFTCNLRLHTQHISLLLRGALNKLLVRGLIIVILKFLNTYSVIFTHCK